MNRFTEKYVAVVGGTRGMGCASAQTRLNGGLSTVDAPG